MKNTSTTPYISVWDRSLAFLARCRIPGYYRLFRLMGGGGHPFILCRTKHGLTLYLNPNSYIDNSIVSTGYYEEEVLQALLQELLDDDVFWDIGANIGLHALTVKKLRPRVVVHAFEPSPQTMNRLSENAVRNGLDIAEWDTALSNRAGIGELSVMRDGNHGLSSLKPWTGVTYQGSVSCHVDTAVALIASGRIPAPNVIKIDVEGAEFEALVGFQGALASVRVIIFEAGHGFLQGESGRDLMELLTSFGFRISQLQGADPNSSNFVAKLHR